MPVLGAVCFKLEKFAEAVEICLGSQVPPQSPVQGTLGQAGDGRGRYPRGQAQLQRRDGAPHWDGYLVHPTALLLPSPPTSIPLPSSSLPAPSYHFPGAARPSQPFVPLVSIVPFV